MGTKKDGRLTPSADKSGVTVTICHIEWYEAGQKYTVASASKRTADLVFDREDLIFLTRVLYAESSGSASLKDKAERLKEKEAILNVKYFRLNRKGYPTNKYVAKTFTEVCRAPGQFESAFSNTPKFANSEETSCEHLAKAECADLQEAVDAIKTFLEKGPNKEFTYDNFRGGAGKHGTTIGRSRFWLSDTGKAMHEKDE
jgi:hypothetical protein